jgi:formylglycine-generating enzyme
MEVSDPLMRKRTAFLVVAALFAAFAFTTQPSAQADTFGTGDNEFTINFAQIGNAGNISDSTGYGAVPYSYRMGRYEITGDQVTDAIALGLTNVSVGGFGGPAISISWFGAAAFVNWLNTSSGYQAAYNLTYSGGWSISPWASSDAWQLGGQNLFRHQDAHYFLPSENEWYKAAYHKNDGDSGNYWDYPTASDSTPANITNILGSVAPNTARFGNSLGAVFVPVEAAGGESPYGTRGQGGNASEFLESAFDGTNDAASETVTWRGGSKSEGSQFMLSSERYEVTMNLSSADRGFRVASVPEPSTYALLVMAGAGALWWTRRKR